MFRCPTCRKIAAVVSLVCSLCGAAVEMEHSHDEDRTPLPIVRLTSTALSTTAPSTGNLSDWWKKSAQDQASVQLVAVVAPAAWRCWRRASAGLQIRNN
jgi:hypothetical protein